MSFSSRFSLHDLLCYFCLSRPLSFSRVTPWGLLQFPSFVWGLPFESLSLFLLPVVLPHMILFVWDPSGLCWGLPRSALLMPCAYAPECLFRHWGFLRVLVNGLSLLAPLLVLFLSPLCISFPHRGFSGFFLLLPLLLRGLLLSRSCIVFVGLLLQLFWGAMAPCPPFWNPLLGVNRLFFPRTLHALRFSSGHGYGWLWCC